MTKEQLAKFGITIEQDSITDEEATRLIEEKFKSVNDEHTKTKNLLSSRNSEIAELKRKDQEKLSEEEKTKLHYEELEKENANYKREIAKNKKVNDYMGIGYPKELAEQIADAELEGKPTVELHKKFITSREESLRKEILENNGNDVHTGDKTKPITLEEFNKMGLADLTKLHEENPTLYAQLDAQSKAK